MRRHVSRKDAKDAKKNCRKSNFKIPHSFRMTRLVISTECLNAHVLGYDVRASLCALASWREKVLPFKRLERSEAVEQLERFEP